MCATFTSRCRGVRIAPEMLVIAILTALGLALCLPLIRISKSTKRLTWTNAVWLALLLYGITTILIAEMPSRFLYWFDAEHVNLSEKFPIIAPVMLGDQYFIVRDIVVNSVQGFFFVAICVATYMWGEKQRKAGRFKG